MAVHKGSLQVHRRRSGARNGSRRTVAAAIRNCHPGFALRSRFSNTYLVGNSCTAQTKSFDFNSSWDCRKQMESVEDRCVWQVSTGCKSCSPPLIIGLSECSALPAAVPGLKFNVLCLKPGLLWHGMAPRWVVRQLLHQIKVSGWPGQITPGKKPAHRVIDISVWVLQKPGELCNFEWGSKNHLVWKDTAKNILQWSEL